MLHQILSIRSHRWFSLILVLGLVIGGVLPLWAAMQDGSGSASAISDPAAASANGLKVPAAGTTIRGLALNP